MDTFVYIVVLECITVFLTAAGCRLALLLRRRVGWHFAIVAAITVTVMEMVWENGILLFRPSDWSANKRSLGGFLLEFFLVTSIDVIPALLVVWHYRKVSSRKVKRGV